MRDREHEKIATAITEWCVYGIAAFLALMVALMAGAAKAQAFSTTFSTTASKSSECVFQSNGGWSCAEAGKSALDQAYAICNKHPDLGPARTMWPEGGGPRQYAKGWESCYKIGDLWDQSETAKAIKAEKEQEARDLEFVKKVAEEAR